jgi:hypothetical protein
MVSPPGASLDQGVGHAVGAGVVDVVVDVTGRQHEPAFQVGRQRGVAVHIELEGDLAIGLEVLFHPVMPTMRLGLSGSDSFKPLGIFSQNICSGAR